MILKLGRSAKYREFLGTEVVLRIIVEMDEVQIISINCDFFWMDYGCLCTDMKFVLWAFLYQQEIDDLPICIYTRLMHSTLAYNSILLSISLSCFSKKSCSVL